MVLQQFIRRLISSQTSETERQLIQKLSETDAMMTAARATHAVVKKVQQNVEQFIEGGSVKAVKPPSPHDPKPLSHEQLTHEEHMAARGGSGFDLMGRLRQVKEQVKSDAAADWQDIKNKFK